MASGPFLCVQPKLRLVGNPVGEGANGVGSLVGAVAQAERIDTIVTVKTPPGAS